MLYRILDFRELEETFAGYFLKFRKNYKLFTTFNEGKNLMRPIRVIVNPHVRQNQVLWSYVGKAKKENAVACDLRIELPRTNNLLFKSRDFWTPIAITVKCCADNWRMSLLHEVGHLFVSNHTDVICIEKYNAFRVEMMSWRIAKTLYRRVRSECAVDFWDEGYAKRALNAWAKYLNLNVDFNRFVIEEMEPDGMIPYESFLGYLWSIFLIG